MSIEIHGLWAENFQKADSYLAFRGSFELSGETSVTFKILASDWYRTWIDGKISHQGPARYNLDYPEYEEVEATLESGKHTISFLVHNTAVNTRILARTEPFLYCNCENTTLKWKCIPLEAFESGIRRINPQLDWIEWCDTNKLPANWQAPDFDDSNWREPICIKPTIGKAAKLSSQKCKFIYKDIQPSEQGRLAEMFSYEKDDPPTRFFLRDLKCENIPADGIWLRYDLGRIRLASPSFTIEMPKDGIVEFAFSEQLSSGRVAPYINCSDGQSANMDHFKAKGGIQKFEPLTPKGGRFLEVHLLGNINQIKIHEQKIIERTYYTETQGDFSSNDELINKIWQTGIVTFKACTEDAVTDNPTRERGQWTGDVVSVGMEIARVGFKDLSIFKRALIQAAQSRNKEGLVAGMSPGASIYVSSFAAQWVNACLRYYQITGDKLFLESNFDYAAGNMRVFEEAITENGLSRDIAWAFIDWGYQIPDNKPDIAMNCHYLNALRAMISWSEITENDKEYKRYTELENKFSTITKHNIIQTLNIGWDELGYHSSVLAATLGLFERHQLSECIEYVKSHILKCFPENPDAARLSSPTLKTSDVITPYFSHFAFDMLIQNGEIDFVLDRYKNCWGWALDQGLTTWPEVFDLRWSHCHQWSGCPTWQLSKYCLGLDHRFDKGKNHFDFTFKKSRLESATGKIILPDGLAEIAWKQQGSKVKYSLKSDEPVTIHGINQETISDIKTLDILI
ncbi:MAG: hypothetical protein ACIAQZ_10045 [Sedimentisphaeraceae bacterium JB056]